MTKKWFIPWTVTVAVAAIFSVSAATASAAGVCSASSPQYCPAPSVQTTAATGVTTYRAVLNGTVNPNGAPTSCTFEYGPTTAYGSLTPAQSIPAGTASVAVSAPLRGLSSHTTFHFQLICTSAGGNGSGGDLTFQTQDRGRSRPSIAQHAAFVSDSGTVGFVVSCFGDRACSGTISLKVNGSKIASSHHFRVGNNKAGVVNMTLKKSALKKLNSKHQLTAKVKVVDSGGRSAKRTVSLRRWI